jgi:hypothetical protein
MDAIDAIIARHQSAHKTSPSKATRKAMVIGLEAVSGLDNNCNKGIVRALLRITTILTPRQQLLS